MEKNKGKHWLVALLLAALAGFVFAMARVIVNNALEQHISEVIRNAWLTAETNAAMLGCDAETVVRFASFDDVKRAICIDAFMGMIQGLVLFFVWVKLSARRYSGARAWIIYTFWFQIVVHALLGIGDVGNTIGPFRAAGYPIPRSIYAIVYGIVFVSVVLRVIIYRRYSVIAEGEEQEG